MVNRPALICTVISSCFWLHLGTYLECPHPKKGDKPLTCPGSRTSSRSSGCRVAPITNFIDAQRPTHRVRTIRQDSKQLPAKNKKHQSYIIIVSQIILSYHTISYHIISYVIPIINDPCHPCCAALFTFFPPVQNGAELAFPSS